MIDICPNYIVVFSVTEVNEAGVGVVEAAGEAECRSMFVAAVLYHSAERII
ncbi:hypothetical protein [Maridesulfovibrio sp. FT414]|uniref:hypothetical protein n=1 Tax=Maridesulfovibrio sp. FT414 TaxID=2979469 RepID=UPI003D803A22